MALKLITMAEIAKSLNIAESTARYYRDRFNDYIPSVGEGKKKRYKPETLDIIRIIAEGFKNNETADQIANELSLSYPINTESQDIAAAAQQQPNLVQLLQVIADQKQLIDDIQIKVDQLQEDIKRIDDRDKLLNELIAEIRQRNKKRKWFDWRKKIDR